MPALAVKHQAEAKTAKALARLAPKPELVTDEALHAAAPSPVGLMHAQLESALLNQTVFEDEKWSPRRTLATMVIASIVLWSGIAIAAVMVARLLF